MSTSLNQSQPKIFFYASRFLLFGLLAITLSACSSFANQQSDSATQVPEEAQHSIGEAAPDFHLQDLQGESLQFSSLKGKMVVMHFATTWCPFCNAEAPHLEALYQAYKDQGVEVLIVDVKEPQELVQQKLQDRFQFSFPLLLDEDGSVAASYAPEGILPDLARDEVVLASNLLIDREGKIQFYSLLDTKNFDAELIALKARLDELL